MLVGYNTNVPYKGKLYHIQTEDNGLKNPLVITLLYYQGSILASKKSSYADLVARPDFEEQVREMMKEQHKAMMKELIRGLHVGDVADMPGDSAEKEPGNAATMLQAEHPQEQQKAGAKQQISKSLDDVLLDYIIRGGK